ILDMVSLPSGLRLMVAASLAVQAQVAMREADIGAEEKVMSDQGHPDHQLKRIVLPSGKTIEVVYFEHPSAPPPADAPELAEAPEAAPVEAPSTDRLLHVCPDCESNLVYPVQWEEADEAHWQITLRCPNCERTEEDVFPQGTCDGFDDELE